MHAHALVFFQALFAGAQRLHGGVFVWHRMAGSLRSIFVQVKRFPCIDTGVELSIYSNTFSALALGKK